MIYNSENLYTERCLCDKENPAFWAGLDLTLITFFYTVISSQIEHRNDVRSDANNYLSTIRMSYGYPRRQKEIPFFFEDRPICERSIL